MRLIILLAIVLFSSCSDSGPSWEETLVRQTSGKSSVKSIDSLVLPFMKHYEIPGFSMAVVKNGQLVFAKGYGFADMAKKTAVTDSSLFRIGTISCTITAIAIMKLIEQGKLTMGTIVFGPNGILGNAGASKPYNPVINQITIENLLQQTSGGWSDGDDPVYMPVLRRSSVSRDTLTGFTLDNIPIKNPPGNVSAFSGFGYFVLGRVIEKVTGQPYSLWVKKNILEPIGIKDMQLTADREEEKKPNESSCYNPIRRLIPGDDRMEEPFFYGRADASFGWIASATDLARVIAAASADSSILLQPSTQKIMFTGSKANPHTASGWFYNDDYKNRFWQAEYQGLTVEFVRAYNGYSWALLVNTNRPGYRNFQADLDQLVWKVLGNNKMEWPNK